jgi:hypothetical protein
MVYFHEHFLCNVICIIMVVDEPICEIVDLPHMQFDKFSKRSVASTLSIQYQLPLPVSGHSVEFLFQVFDD